MCDFKPGDEVVCVDDQDWVTAAPAWMFWTKTRPSRDVPRKGHVYVVNRVTIAPRVDNGSPDVFVVLQTKPRDQWQASMFRKVQRRDLTAWLKTSIGNTDRLDKRQTKKVPA